MSRSTRLQPWDTCHEAKAADGVKGFGGSGFRGLGCIGFGGPGV